MDLAQAGKRLAKQLLVLQLALLFLMGVAGIVFFALSSAFSFVTGGTLSVITNAVFSYYIFRFSGASKNQQVINSMKKGNKAKMIITILGFMTIFSVPQLDNLPAVLGYGSMMLLQYPLLLLVHRLHSQKAMTETDF